MNPPYADGAWLLVLARLAPLGLGLSLFSRSLFGAAVSASLVLSLAVFFAPLAGPGAAALPSLVGPTAVVLVLREFCLGTLVVLSLLLPLYALGLAGRFAEFTSSLGSRLRSGPVATLYGLCAAALCLQLGLHRSLVLGLDASLRLAPLAAPPLNMQSWAFGVVQLVAASFALALSLGLALLLSTWLIEVGSSVFVRATGLSGAAFGPALKGPVFLLLALGLLAPAVAEVPAALRVFQRLLRELTQGAVQ